MYVKQKKGVPLNCFTAGTSSKPVPSIQGTGYEEDSFIGLTLIYYSSLRLFSGHSHLPLD